MMITYRVLEDSKTGPTFCDCFSRLLLFHSVAFTIGVLDGKSTVLGMGTSNRRYLRRINDRRQQDRCFHWSFLKFVTSFSRGGTDRNILLLHKRERDNP